MDVRFFASLPDRDLRREGILIGEGRLVASRVAERCRLLAVLAEPSAAQEAESLAAGRCAVTVLDADEIESIAGYAFHRGILVAAERPQLESLASISLAAGPLAATAPAREIFHRIVVLPNPTDPENLGAVARSAAALGWDGLVLGREACDPFGRRALRCSMAATLTLPLFQAENERCLEYLREADWIVVSAALEEGALEPAALRGMDRLALVLGNEKSGIPSDWRDRSAHAVAIPQLRNAADGVDSLNVAAAAAILLWEGRPSSLQIS